jgi:hypothetical protein
MSPPPVNDIGGPPAFYQRDITPIEGLFGLFPMQLCSL